MYNRNIKENEDKVSKFHAERIEAFDKLESRFEDIKKSNQTRENRNNKILQR